jgi:hypothetical protein
MKPEKVKEMKPEKPKPIKKSKCTKSHPDSPCKDGQYSKPPHGCCYKTKTLKKVAKASIRKRTKPKRTGSKGTEPKRTKRKKKNNKRSLRRA